MLFDVVEEIRRLVEGPVASRLKQVDGDVEELKRGSIALSGDVHGRLGKLEQHALGSVLESAGMRYASVLKEWTGKASATIVYDSMVDEFTHDGLFNKVRGKRNIAVVATTTDGDVFGGFYSVAATKQGQECFYDTNIFVLSFESHGRCETPQRFAVKEELQLLKPQISVNFQKVNSTGLVVFWVGGAMCGFWLGDERSNSFSKDMSHGFKGLKDTTLSGRNNTNHLKPPYHRCIRLLAVQLSEPSLPFINGQSVTV